MTPADQEALFEKVREKFPQAHTRFHSGYVHGVASEVAGQIPSPGYLERNDAYANGYCAGFADARGPDVLELPGVAEAGIHAEDIQFEWWKHDSD